MRTKIPLLLSFAAAVVVLWPGDVAARTPRAARSGTSPVSKKVTASASGAVQIRAVATQLEIVGTSRKEVAVTGFLPDGYELQVESGKSSTEVTVKPPRHSSKGNGRLKIEVPAGSAVDVRGVSSDIKVSAIKGEIVVETVSGSIISDGNGDEVQANSVSGKVEIRGGKKRTSARTVSGRIEIHHPEGRLSAQSVSGKVSVDDAKTTKSSLTTVSGSLFFDGVLAPQGPHELTCHSGSIELHLPKDQPVDIHASTHAGSIRSELGSVEARNKARITVGSGGPTVNLRTFAGSISIKAR